MGRGIPSGLYQQIFETLSEGVVVLGRAGEVIAVNRTALDIIGASTWPTHGARGVAAGWEVLREDGSPCPIEEFPGLYAVRNGCGAHHVHHVVRGIRRPDSRLVWISSKTRIIGEDGGGLAGCVICNFSDITPMKALEHRLRDVIDAAPVSIAMLDREARFVLVNRRLALILGGRARDLEGRAVCEVISAVLPEKQCRAQMAHIERCLAEGRPIEFDDSFAQPDGGLRHTHGYYVPLLEDEAVSGIVAASVDVSELRHAHDELDHKNRLLRAKIRTISALQARLLEQSVRDGLTGLYNRRYLDETLPRELALAARKRHPVCLAMADLDHFKRINDRLGHQAGDEMLRRFAELLKRNCRAGDLVCRYGGEEFVVVMIDSRLDDARARAEQIRVAFGELEVHFGPEVLRDTVSIGVAALPEHGGDATWLLRAADEALYAAKGAGRNRVMVYCG